MKHRIAAVYSALLLFLCLGQIAYADGVWQLPGRGVWQNPLSWFGDVPNGVGDIASFDTFAPRSRSTIRVEFR